MSFFSFILALTLIFYCRKSILKFLSGIDKKYWILLAVIFCLGLFFRLQFSPFTHLMDAEYDFMSIAKIAAEKNTIPDSRLTGYPLLLSFSFLLFGFSNTTTYYWNIFLTNFVILAIFLFTYSLFQNKKIAIYSSFIAAVSPLFLLFSSISAVNLISATFVLFALFIFTLYYKSNNENKKLFYCSIFLLAFSLNRRIENFLLLLLLFPLYINKEKRVKRLNFWLPLLILLLLSLPTILLISTGGGHGLSSLEEGFLGREYILEDLRLLDEVFIGHLIKPMFAPTFFIFFSIIGIIVSIRIYFTKRKNFGSKKHFSILLLFYWFGSYLVLYLSLNRVGIHWNMAINIYPVYIIFSCIGIYTVETGLIKLFKTNKQFYLTILIISIILISFLFFTSENVYWKRINGGGTPITELPILLEKDIKDNCTVLVIGPSEFLELFTNLSVIEWSRITNEDRHPEDIGAK